MRLAIQAAHVSANLGGAAIGAVIADRAGRVIPIRGRVLFNEAAALLAARRS